MIVLFKRTVFQNLWSNNEHCENVSPGTLHKVSQIEDCIMMINDPTQHGNDLKNSVSEMSYDTMLYFKVLIG